MSDMISTGLDWLADKQQEFVAREVTYRRPSTGESVTLTVGIGSSQLAQINTLGDDRQTRDFLLSDPIEVDRDYIILASELGSLHPPQPGDVVDDTNDETGVTKRYRVMSIPGQTPWRWLQGSYHKQLRAHTKFFADVETLWDDAFTGSNGTNLTSHAPTEPSGGSYGGGTGTLTIQSNRIVSGGSGQVYRYFNPAEADTISIADLNINEVAADLNGQTAQFGLAVRCETSGAGLRKGYYCTLQVGYTGATQSTKKLLILEQDTTLTEVASVTLADDVSLTATYQLIVENDTELDRITVKLMDALGEIQYGSVDYAAPLFDANTGQAVYFNHTATFDSWMDDLTVEAA